MNFCAFVLSQCRLSLCRRRAWARARRLWCQPRSLWLAEVLGEQSLFQRLGVYPDHADGRRGAPHPEVAIAEGDRSGWARQLRSPDHARRTLVDFEQLIALAGLRLAQADHPQIAAADRQLGRGTADPDVCLKLG